MRGLTSALDPQVGSPVLSLGQAFDVHFKHDETAYSTRTARLSPSPVVFLDKNWHQTRAFLQRTKLVQQPCILGATCVGQHLPLSGVNCLQ